MNARKRVLLVDDPYHARTKSSTFFRDLVAREYDVESIHVSVGSLTVEEEVNLVSSFDPDIVLAWQSFLQAPSLKKLKLPYLWVPMFDAARSWTDQGWCEAALSGAPILAFSDAVARIASRLGLEAVPVRYFPEPQVRTAHRSASAFFWYRGSVQPDEFASVFKEFPARSITIKNDPDPNHSLVPCEKGRLDDRLHSVVEGFLDREDYDALVGTAAVYVAPRKVEGIGLSFLEAMARGCAIVAYDAPTMNEYIVDDRSGILFGGARETRVRPCDVPRLQDGAYASVVAGHRTWLQDEARILDAISGLGRPIRRSFQLGARIVQGLRAAKRRI